MSTKLNKKPVQDIRAKDERRRRVSGRRVGEPPSRRYRPAAVAFFPWTPDRIPAARDRPCPELPLPGIWCAWDASIVYRFIQQTTLGLATRGMRRMERFAMRRRIAPMQRAWAARVGIRVPLAGTSPMPQGGGKLLTPCLTCRRPATWLVYAGSWWCTACAPMSLGHASGLHLNIARYQCALILGAAGGQIERRRDRLAVSLRNAMFRPTLASHSTFTGLLMAGTALLQIPVRWRYQRVVRGDERYTPGPFFTAVAPYLMPALVEGLLRPEAYARAYERMLRG